MSVPKNLAFLIPEILARPAIAGRARTLPVPPVGRPVGRREEDVRTPLAAAPVHHTDRKPALYLTSAASGWQPSLLRCNAVALFSCVLSAILTEERASPVPAEARHVD